MAKAPPGRVARLGVTERGLPARGYVLTALGDGTATYQPGGGSGIRFNTDNEGGWLDVTANDLDGTGLYGIHLFDHSDGTFFIESENDILLQGGTGQSIRIDGTDGGVVVNTFLDVTGATGATAESRYMGATASGSPASGTFEKGDYVIDQTGAIWICTTAGSPGTWAQVGAGGSAIQTREQVASSGNVTIANGGSDAIKSDTKISGSNLLDFTDPQIPIVVAAGVYAVTATVGPGADLTAGGSFTVQLYLDASGTPAIGSADSAPATATQAAPAVSVSVTYYVPLGGQIEVVVVNNDGVSSRPFLHFQNMVVQRLS